MATDTVLQVAEAMSASRPRVLRRDTEAMILSYYQSDLAGQPYMGDQDSDQQLSTTGFEASTRQAGASDHSSPFPGGTKATSLGSAAVHRRKHSNNVESGADNRRVAIVPLEVDAPPDETGRYFPSAPTPAQATLPSPLAGRRELVVDAQLAASGSALIAPPDSNLFSLHDFSSPLTPSFPFTPSSLSPSTSKSPQPLSSEKQEKSRHAPSIQHSRTSSRDIGIVGTVTRFELPQDIAALQDTSSDYQPPIFQTPSSCSSSSTAVDSTSLESDPLTQTSSSDAVHVRPTVMSATVEPIHSHSLAMNGHGVHTQPHSAHPLTASSRSQLVGTLEQAQSSSADASSMSTAPSSYLYYQPGVHSKAGPLPPPPRAMFDIDFNTPPPPRPPRLRSPSPLNSQKPPGAAAPASVTVRLASKASAASIHQIHITTTTPSVSAGSSSGNSEYSPEPEHEPTSTVHHTREGAFPPSTIIERQHSLPDETISLAPELPSKDHLPDPPAEILDSAPALTAPPANNKLSPLSDVARSPRDNSLVSNSNDSGHISSEGSRHAFEDQRQDAPQELNGSYPSIREFTTENSPPEPKRKMGLLTNLKRYSSLPRTPSIKSPISIFTRSPTPPRRRIRARSPDAMRFRDILNKRSALERAIGYANKINELSMYDCGLGEWVTSMKERGSSKTRLVPASPSQYSDSSLALRPSRASISSEVTFPLRADAYIATDLSQRDIDTVPSPNVPPPALPYPALAGVTSTTSFRHSTITVGSPLSHATSLSTGSKISGGFFSLGRHSSTRKDSISTKQAPHLRLTKQPTTTTTAPNPRPVQITSAPSVPGGPRALPNRMQRSRTLMLGSSSASSESTSPSPPVRRRSNTLKRPSFFGRSAGPSPPAPEPDAPANTEFTRQVERLADLLPHADRDVLAGYLRRAGQDVLAIGQYLEDEKNGSVRRD